MPTAIFRAILAGFAATVVLSILMVIKSAVGLVPEFNAVEMLTRISTVRFGIPPDPMIGWMAHFLIGTVLWGVAFAVLSKSWTSVGPLARALVFSAVAWLLMMVIVMPLAGAGLFAAGLGVGAAIAALVLHLVYGAVLGLVYARVGPPSSRTAHPPESTVPD